MSKVEYTTDLLIFGIDSRENDNLRSLPSKYLSILLVRRNKEPFKGQWSLPGGYVLENEIALDASQRILTKETGLKDVYMQQVGIYDSIKRDPRGRTISSSYMALIDRTLLKQEISMDACWFDIELQENEDNINIKLTNGIEKINYVVKRECISKKGNDYDYRVVEPSDLAFDHEEIIIRGIMILRDKVWNTDIVFDLMPKEFTIGQLKQVYSLILGKELVNSAFRRVIASKVIETGKMVKTGGHRPSVLCSYKERD